MKIDKDQKDNTNIIFENIFSVNVTTTCSSKIFCGLPENIFSERQSFADMIYTIDQQIYGSYRRMGKSN